MIRSKERVVKSMSTQNAFITGAVAASVALAAVLATPAWAQSTTLPAGCSASGDTVTCSYAAVDAEQQFTVPAGVSGVHVDLIGARGFGPDAYPGEVVSDLPVSPGQTLYVEVGGSGGAAQVSTAVDTASTPGGAGGFNGGGAGGDAEQYPYGLQSGGGGGGASDVRTCSSGSSSCDSLGSRLMVAGGGGGLGGLSTGGNGGAPDGQNGQMDNPNAKPGFGGTQTAGGAPGGAGARGNPYPGTAGQFGQGGKGGPNGLAAIDYGGGGGGGGYYGGGGGLANGIGVGPPGSQITGGGGGGSSYGPAGSTFSVHALTDPASVTISYVVAATTLPPPAPTIDTATAGDSTATVGFTPPDTTGGPPITGYTVTSSPDATHPDGVTATATTSPITVTGLTDGTSYTFTVTATNSAGTGPASAASNPVTPTAPLAITTTTPVKAGAFGSPYTGKLAAEGGTAPYTWSLAPGSSLPAGLTLHADGTIDGTPTGAGTVTFTAQATDAGTPAQTATRLLTLIVTPATTRTTLTSSTNPSLQRQPVALTATVTGPTGQRPPSGTVTLTDGSTALQTLTLDGSGTATFTISSLTTGSHALQATYDGTGADLGSTSPLLTEVINPVTAARLTALTGQYVESSAAFKKLSPATQRVVTAVLATAAQQLAHITPPLTGTQKARLMTAYIQAVAYLKSHGYLTPDQATTLTNIATAM